LPHRQIGKLILWTIKKIKFLYSKAGSTGIFW
jgi:hypothetical protein